MKDVVSAKDVCKLLNELLQLDYNATQSLIKHRAECNNAVSDHPTILASENKISMLGFINSLFECESLSGRIAYELNDDSVITKFIVIS